MEPRNGAGIRQVVERSRPSGKGIPYTCTGREVTADAACTVGKHPLPISPSRDWFALFTLCQAVRAGEAESELTGRRSCGRRDGRRLTARDNIF